MYAIEKNDPVKMNLFDFKKFCVKTTILWLVFENIQGVSINRSKFQKLVSPKSCKK